MRVEALRIVSAVVMYALITMVTAGCGGGAEEEPAPQVEEQAAEPSEEPVQRPARQPAAEETAAEEPAVVREAAESPFGFYTIQLSAWRTRVKADREAERYQEMGLEAYVQQAEIPGMGTWYRVRVGRYPSLSEAREAAAALVDIEQSWVDNFGSEEVPPGA